MMRLETSNQAMELTASRRTTLLSDDFFPFTRCHARSRSQQLILFSLDAERTSMHLPPFCWSPRRRAVAVPTSQSRSDWRRTCFRCIRRPTGPLARATLRGSVLLLDAATSSSAILSTHHFDRRAASAASQRQLSGSRPDRLSEPHRGLSSRPERHLRAAIWICLDLSIDAACALIKASNQAMQRTAGRSAITLSMIPTPLVLATRALARGR